MSRCFPFPPPGYEAKTRIDVDSLKKEKRKDKKKHKKENKCKEKNKDRSKDSRENHLREKYNEINKEKFRDEDGKKNSDERRIELQVEAYGGGANGGVGLQVGEVRDSKFVEELCMSIKEDEKGTRNQKAEKFSSKTQRGDENMYNGIAKASNNGGEGKENNEHNYMDNIREEEQENRNEDRCTGNPKVKNISRLHQRKTVGEIRKTEKDYVNNKEREGNDEQEGRQKYSDWEKKSNGMDKNNDKEKKQEDKTKEKVVQRNKEQNKLEESGKNHTLSTLNNDSAHLPKDSIMNATTEENCRKRKDLKTNGIVLGNGIHPCKRPAFSSQAFEENGKSTALGHALDGWGAANNHNAETGGDSNHIIEVQPSSTGLRCPPITNTHTCEKAIASTKLQHPDSKYLSSILSVPKMEECSEIYDQDWLFSNDNIHTKKPRVPFGVIDETPQVWEKALQIETADTCALPYVIPY